VVEEGRRERFKGEKKRLKKEGTETNVYILVFLRNQIV
jgi:hypothetical protein